MAAHLLLRVLLLAAAQLSDGGGATDHPHPPISFSYNGTSWCELGPPARHDNRASGFGNCAGSFTVQGDNWSTPSALVGEATWADEHGLRVQISWKHYTNASLGVAGSREWGSCASPATPLPTRPSPCVAPTTISRRRPLPGHQRQRHRPQFAQLPRTFGRGSVSRASIWKTASPCRPPRGAAPSPRPAARRRTRAGPQTPRSASSRACRRAATTHPALRRTTSRRVRRTASGTARQAIRWCVRKSPFLGHFHSKHHLFTKTGSG